MKWSVALAVGLLLAGCGKQTAVDQLDSAKKSLAKNDARGAAVYLKNALQGDPNLFEARVLLGKTLMMLGDANGALIEFRKAKEAKSDQEELVPMIATAMLLKGDFDRLVADYGDVELHDPKHQAEVQAVVATALGIKRRPAQAQQMATEALRADPDNLTAQLVLVRVRAVASEWAEAQKAVDLIIQKQPKAFQPLLLKAELMSAEGRAVKEQIDAYAAVLNVDATNIAALAALVGLYSNQKDFEAAQRYMRTLQSSYPKHPLTQFQNALLAAQTGDINKGNEIAQQLLKVAPDHPGVLHLAGALAYKKGNYLQATSYLGKAMGLAESSKDIRVLLARSYLRLGEHSRALIALRPLLDRPPVPLEAVVAAAEVYLQQGDTKQAETYFSQAAKRDPSDKFSQAASILASSGESRTSDLALKQLSESDQGTVGDFALIALRISKRQLDEAMEAINALEKKLPGKPLLPVLKGRVELLRGDVGKARAFFEAAQSIDPQFVPAVNALANLDVQGGKRDDAVARLRKLVDERKGMLEAEMAIIGLRAEGGAPLDEMLELIQQTIKRHPDDAQPRLALIKARLDAGQFKEALSAAQESVTAFPQEPAVFDALARVQLALGDTNQSLAAATKMATLQPQSPVPFYRMAQIERARNDTAAAISHLQRALAVRDDYLVAQVELANLLAAAGKAKEARALAQTVRVQRPKEPTGWVLVGDVERELKQFGAAVTAYEAAQKTVESSEVAVRLHAALHLAGRGEVARKLQGTWLVAHPTDIGFRHYLAERALREDNYELAERSLEEILRLTPADLLALNNLAFVQLRLSKPAAMATIERALKLAPKAPVLLDTQAMILDANANLLRALEVQREAVALAPELAEHRLHLAQYLKKAGKRDEARAEAQKLVQLGSKFPGQADVKALLASL